MFLVPFEDPERARKRMAARAESALSRARPWGELKPPRGHDVGIIAETFQIENPMDLVFPDAPVIEAGEGEDRALYSENRWLRYSKKIIPRGFGMPVTEAKSLWHDSGRAFFTEDVTVPVLEHRRDSNGRLKGWKPWMSLTPNEVWTLRSGIRAATKKVTIAGLGMGYLLNEVAKKKSVMEIIVIEKDAELIGWFGEELCYKLEEKYMFPITILHDDFWRLAENGYDKEDRFLIDIWEGHGEAKWDRRLEEFRKEYRYVWAWGSPRGGR